MQKKPEKGQATATGSKLDRRQRLAAELRANLMKRKAQSRKRQQETKDKNEPGREH